VRRLRALAGRPVDPEVARAVVVLALALAVGLAGLVGLSAGGGGDAGSARPAPASMSATPTTVRPSSTPSPVISGAHRRRQDPQDRPGTAAHRRAMHELASHRALQHVPWHRQEVAISLIGARRGKAVLAVVGPTLAADRRGRREFLRRYRDDGRSYLFRLRLAKGGRR
jgi:hypothetical protein